VHLFRVRDEGIGIPESHLGAIFEAFRQLDGTMSRAQEGTGLGLTLCKKFTELLGGMLTVRSAVGSGTTFTLYLPEDPNIVLEQADVEETDGQSACG
jgi:signal transduction histidine kinase